MADKQVGEVCIESPSEVNAARISFQDLVEIMLRSPEYWEWTMWQHIFIAERVEVQSVSLAQWKSSRTVITHYYVVHKVLLHFAADMCDAALLHQWRHPQIYCCKLYELLQECSFILDTWPKKNKLGELEINVCGWMQVRWSDKNVTCHAFISVCKLWIPSRF